MSTQEQKAFAKADMIFTICAQCDIELDEKGRSELLRIINAAYEGNESFGSRMLLAIESFLRKELDNPPLKHHIVKVVKCHDMPVLVAKLADYGLYTIVSNQYDEHGSSTDYFIVQAVCSQEQWDAAMARTPKWM
jgi:hypothetical protein